MIIQASTEQTLRMRRVRSAIQVRSPFFGNLMLGLVMVPEPRVKTMLTDGKHLWYSPTWFDSLSFEWACFAVAHEVFHCAAGHPFRCGDRNLKLFQYAADYVTNPEIVKAGFAPIPGMLYDPRFEGMSLERVYNILVHENFQPPADEDEEEQNKQNNDQNGTPGNQQGQQPQPGNQQGAGNQPSQGQGQPGQGTGQGQPDQGQGQTPGTGQGGASNNTDPFGGHADLDCGGMGGVIPPRNDDGTRMTKAAQDHLRYQWTVDVNASRMVVRRGIGKAPGEAATITREVQNPKADWRDELRQFMRMAMSNEYSWLNPDRRLITPAPGRGKGLYIPSLYSRRMPGIVVGADSSRSMDDRMLQIVSDEFNAILDEVHPAFVDVIFCDSVIQKEQRYEPDEFPVPLTFPGRGGTRVAPVFEKVEEYDYIPVCMVYFTDLEVNDFPEEEPPYPVLWASTKYDKHPWGQLLMLDEI